MSKSGTLQASLAVIAGIAVVAWLQLNVFNKPNDIQDSPTVDKVEDNSDVSGEVIKQAIKIINSSCPMKVDEATRLDSACYLPGNILAEYFTLVNTERTSIDTAIAKPRIAESILTNIKTNSSYAAFRSYKITFLFIYLDKAGKAVFNIPITPEQYNN